MENNRPLIKQLKQFYEENAISAANFQCPGEHRCRKATENAKGRFSTAQEIEIGKRYFDSRPEIVVVSLDPGSQKDEGEKLKLRIRNEPATRGELGPRNKHWYRTHEGVAAIVKAVTGNMITPEQAAP